ncbi:flagellar biosynthesis protein FlhA [Falsigemmobacter intermedius]|uniref:Flagellar biosynthesis protein FlhA n=1 Tax=Falsigemmobacter intermedius TaxID=1553448 RepID=A0A444MEW5_9RHOB|nr:flagellar biosynthesis protein FlhA [Falsigemmobacter intermedius]RWY43531.1 flagellar biosynthesis protein FlhA [Falsigemmobacter intermedius]
MLRNALLQPTVLLSLALLTIILMMVLPMPAWLLDIGLAASFALAILIFTVTLFVERPLDFSSFPTILLASLMLRLALNVASTRLIISQGHTGPDAAGSIIEGFAGFLMSGSVLQGVVVFCVLLIVNFMVITKGAGRMAEVGARFALDGLPGRQLAIDADMSAGAIDATKARHRREKELAETTFFGSLDGVSKFVRGDAIAGLLITGLNMIVGLSVGVFSHGMPLSQAVNTYTMLTVGDALVGQIPAVIISVASALLLARGAVTGSADQALFTQLGRFPAALLTVAGLLAVFALFPGLPFLPFIASAALLGALALRKRRTAALPVHDPEPLVAARRKPIGDMIDLDDIHVEVAPDLVTLILDPGTGLDARISSIRTHVATNFGIILPEIRLTDEATLPGGTYRILIQGAEAARDSLRAGRALVLQPAGTDLPAPPGEDVREPVYGAPARWIAAENQEAAVLNGLTVVSPSEVLATHLLEVIKEHLPRLLTLRGLRRLFDELTSLSDPARSEANRRLLDDLIPEKVAPEQLLSVLRLLLEERVSVRNLPLILEAMSEIRHSPLPPEAICEHVRRRLSFQLIAALRRSDGTIPLVQLAPEWDQAFSRYQIDADRGLSDIALPPEEFQKLSNGLSSQISRATEQGLSPAVITSAQRRRFLHSVLTARRLPVPVLSYEELGTSARPSLVGQVPA